MRFSVNAHKQHQVEVLLFRNVQNAGQVVSDMLSGAFAACLIDAAMVADLFVIFVATSTALRRRDDGEKVTRNIFTDILYQLSPTRNITQSLKMFGVSDKTTDIIAVIPDPTDEQLAILRKGIQATEELPPSQLSTIHTPQTEQHLRKCYAIEQDEMQSSSLVDSIVTRIACRDIK